MALVKNAKPDLLHLWHPTLDKCHDNDDSSTLAGPTEKMEIKAGYICLVFGSTFGSHDKSWYCSFVTSTEKRILDEYDINDFKTGEEPVTVNLHNDCTLNDDDLFMLFYIDSDGYCQHGSQGKWIRHDDLFGKPTILQPGSWTRQSPKVVRRSIDAGLFRDFRHRMSVIESSNILENQTVLYKMMSTLREKFALERVRPLLFNQTSPPLSLLIPIPANPLIPR